MRRILVLLAAFAAFVLATGGVASAHPLGNATVNHYDGLTLSRDRIDILAVEDVAEIPTFQRSSQISAHGEGSATAAERAGYAAAQCHSLALAARLVVDGRPRPLTVGSSDYSERPGAIGLEVGRLACRLGAAVDLSRPAVVTFSDTFDSQGVGWHEVTAVGSGVQLLNSPLPAVSISDQLRRYPNDLLSSPLNVSGGTLHSRPGAGASSYASAHTLAGAGFGLRQLQSLATTFNATVGRKHLTVGVGLLGVLLALALGGGHALLPGHGKTIMAAYLVGRRGRLRDVVSVGATVTITHTLGVLVLGLVLSTTASFAPTAAEQLLGVVSGLLVTSVGVVLLRSALRRRPWSSGAASPAADPLCAAGHHGAAPPSQPAARQGLLDALGPVPAGAVATLAAVRTVAAPGADRQAEHDLGGHDHGGHDHAGYDHGGHDHGGHDHGGHDHAGHSVTGVHSHGWGTRHTHRPAAPGPDGAQPGSGSGFTRGGLVGLGVAGGLVPSPSALLVLLAATALGRTAFGIALVVAYGVGMAGALCLAGLLLVRFRDRLARVPLHRLRWGSRWAAWAPAATSLLVVAVGVGLALRALGGSV